MSSSNEDFIAEEDEGKEEDERGEEAEEEEEKTVDILSTEQAGEEEESDVDTPVCKVIMMTHGQDEMEDTFCGWFNSNLTPKGEKESAAAGEVLKNQDVKVDAAYCSVLTRARRTLDIVLKTLQQESVSITRSWELNARHYGALTGLNRESAAVRYGEDQIEYWLCSESLPPPRMTKNHKYFNLISYDKIYGSQIKKDEFPLTETAQTAMERGRLFWTKTIEPHLRTLKTVLIVGHESNLKGIMQYFEDMSDMAALKVRLARAVPFSYELNAHSKATSLMKYMVGEKAVKCAMRPSYSARSLRYPDYSL